VLQLEAERDYLVDQLLTTHQALQDSESRAIAQSSAGIQVGTGCLVRGWLQRHSVAATLWSGCNAIEQLQRPRCCACIWWAGRRLVHQQALRAEDHAMPGCWYTATCL